MMSSIVSEPCYGAAPVVLWSKSRQVPEASLHQVRIYQKGVVKPDPGKRKGKNVSIALTLVSPYLRLLKLPLTV